MLLLSVHLVDMHKNKSYRISVRSLNNHNENGFVRQSDVRWCERSGKFI